MNILDATLQAELAQRVQVLQTEAAARDAEIERLCAEVENLQAGIRELVIASGAPILGA